ncbi:MAG: hypothetical protein KJZ87_05275 [Thermoguttaceae bacterium]|nr:hypothetical protein [Thermoguttaceae bacterium]
MDHTGHQPPDLPHSDPTRNDVNTATLAVLGTLGGLLTFAIIVLVTVVFNQVQNREEYAKQVNYQPQQIADLVHDQMGRLTEVRWVDRQKGIVTIPIDRAMVAVVNEIREGTWKAPQGPPPDQPAADRQPDAAPDAEGGPTTDAESNPRPPEDGAQDDASAPKSSAEAGQDESVQEAPPTAPAEGDAEGPTAPPHGEQPEEVSDYNKP